MSKAKELQEKLNKNNKQTKLSRLNERLEKAFTRSKRSNRLNEDYDDKDVKDFMKVFAKETGGKIEKFTVDGDTINVKIDPFTFKKFSYDKGFEFKELTLLNIEDWRGLHLGFDYKGEDFYLVLTESKPIKQFKKSDGSKVVKEFMKLTGVAYRDTSLLTNTPSAMVTSQKDFNRVVEHVNAKSFWNMHGTLIGDSEVVNNQLFVDVTIKEGMARVKVFIEPDEVKKLDAKGK